MGYRFTLEKYSGIKSRYKCPECNKPKVFTRYVDTETGLHIHETVGICSRVNSCGYRKSPKEYFNENGIEKPNPVASFKAPQVKQAKPKLSFIDHKLFEQSLTGYDRNKFVHFLKNTFGNERAREAIERYYIGTSGHWQGSTIFWNIDINNRIRTGKIMLYDPATGKRIKEPYNHITWVHKVINKPNLKDHPKLFGGHLLKDKTRTVAIVESEKSAIICSLYKPDFIWLAVGSMGYLTASNLEAVKGRKVILYPDLGAYDIWKAKADKLAGFAKFTVSDLLERVSTDQEKQSGLDIADYFLRFPVPDPVKEPDAIPDPEPPPAKDRFKASLLNEAVKTGFGNTYKWFTIYEKQGLTESEAITTAYDLKRENGFIIEGEEQKEKPKPEAIRPLPKQVVKIDWGVEIEELSSFFSGINLPTDPVQIGNYLFIEKPSLMVNTHLATIRANNGNKTFRPFLDRLQQLKTHLIK